jgi:hypothetical protein
MAAVLAALERAAEALSPVGQDEPPAPREEQLVWVGTYSQPLGHIKV